MEHLLDLLLLMRSFKMIITNAQYIKNSDKEDVNGIYCLVDGTPHSVPLNPENRHYAEILKQVKEGTLTIKDAD